MDVVKRQGEYYRVSDPSWTDPFNGGHSMRAGARWNAQGSFPVTYLNADIGTARANARFMLTEKFRGQPFRAEDVDPSERPMLVSTEVPPDTYLDIVSPIGCLDNGLPASYPLDDAGITVSWPICQPVGQRAWDAGLPGIACRSTAPTAPADGEELAWFDRHVVNLEPKETRAFEDWYGPIDW